MNKDSFLLRASFRSFMKKMVLNNLMAFMGSIVNGIVISRYLGLTAMAAFQLTLPLVFVIMIISQIVSLGVQNNCAKSIGAGHQDEAADFYSTAIACCLPLAALMGFAIFHCAGPLALLLGADGAGACPEAADYLRGIAPGLALLVFLPMQVAVFFLEGLSKYALWAIAVQTMLNVFGAIDLFPLTGVTFPFVSTGGTSLLTSWAMLAYFKATDMRRDASLAVRKEERL
jgi:Na+-driven multidrug efflux pump